MGFFSDPLSFLTKLVDASGAKSEYEASEMDIYKHFMGNFGFYTQAHFDKNYKDSSGNLLLTQLESNLSFTEVANRAKSEGYDFFIFATPSETSTALKGQGYFGKVLDNNYDFKNNNLSISDSKINYLNVYPVYEASKVSENVPSPITPDVKNYYLQQALTQVATRLKTEVENVQRNQKKAELLSLAYQECRAKYSDAPDEVEKCVQNIRDKTSNENMTSIEDQEKQIKILKDKLNILRLKNRYEAESNNHLINQNSNNNKFFTAIKSTLTDNYNSISKINNAILNVSNKLKTNTSIFGMKSGIVKMLTSLVVIMIVLAIGFAAYFAYQAAKKYFPFTLQGLRTGATPPKTSTPSTTTTTNQPNRFGNPTAPPSAPTPSAPTPSAPSKNSSRNSSRNNSRTGSRNNTRKNSSNAPNTLGF